MNHINHRSDKIKTLFDILVYTILIDNSQLFRIFALLVENSNKQYEYCS